MSTVALFIAATSAISAVGLAALVWFALGCANEDSRQFVGFDGMRFED